MIERAAGPRAWSLISVGADRQYAGNRGYADELRRVYQYDSNVANCRNVRPGDLALVRDRERLLGLALIERIDEKPATKTMLRCPICDSVDLKPRKNKRPKFRCSNRHEFETPNERAIRVTSFEAHYEDTYIDAPDAVSVSALKAAAPRPNDQLSIEEIDIARLEVSLVTSHPSTRELIGSFLQGLALDSSSGASDEDTADGSPYSPSMTDTRNSVLRAIKARRGQRKFRNALLKRYGAQCLISGCQLLDVLEAAHIWPYRGDQDNHPGNGLLLRADLHTLFDLDLIGICPVDLEVRLAPPLRRVPDYHVLGGQRLRISTAKPERRPLDRRWRTFQLKWGTE